jgi:hypothetical protein
VKYSQGKWGFSVQKRVYVECGAKFNGKDPGGKIWREFCRRVGWLTGNSYVNHSDFTYNPSISPAGEFPWLLVGRVATFQFIQQEEIGRIWHNAMNRNLIVKSVLGRMAEERMGFPLAMRCLFSRIETCKF